MIDWEDSRIPKIINSLTESQRQKLFINIMGEVLNHIARHAAMEAAKGAGCMVTLLAMLTGIGTIFSILGLIILK